MESVLDLLHHTVTSPWVYLVIFAVTAVDAFFPAVPGETVVITAGVFAAGGEPALVAVIVAAALGALVGDHVSYAIGRGGGAHRLARLPADSRRRAGSEWARRAVDRRGGSILTTSRYVPGGRTAVTLTMGAVRYPLPRFLFFDALAAGTWALYCGLLGYFGGLAFERDPVKGLLVGVGLSLAVTGLVELARWLRRRAHRRAATHR
ncbi:DedA family protein [Micromonospora coxensis]|uniref:DedA family protein n=1 Tax=Micromonospora coxensis TaxID=356852 RepID=UPI003433001A